MFFSCYIIFLNCYVSYINMTTSCFWLIQFLTIMPDKRENSCTSISFHLYQKKTTFLMFFRQEVSKICSSLSRKVYENGTEAINKEQLLSWISQNFQKIDVANIQSLLKFAFSTKIAGNKYFLVKSFTVSSSSTLLPN